MNRPDPAGPPLGDHRAGGYKWALVGMLWFICFFNYADRQAISSVLPLLEREYGFSKEEQGLIGGAFMWVYGISAPLAGMVGDRANRKWVILAGLYIWSVITGFTALCSKFWHFVLVRGAEGLGETFYFPATLSLVSEYHGQATRSRAMGLHQSAVYAGIIGGGVLTGWLAEDAGRLAESSWWPLEQVGLLSQRFGWRFPFVAFGAAGVLLGLVLARFLHEPGRTSEWAPGEGEGHPTSEPGAATMPWLEFVRLYLGSPASLTLLLGFVGANVVAGVLYVWLTTFMKDKFHLSLAMAGLMGTLFLHLASMAGSLTGGVVADRWRQSWLGGRVAVQAAGITLAIPMVLVCALAERLWVVVAGMICLGFAKGVYDSNIWASMYEVVPASRRSSAVGVANLVGWGGAGIGSWKLGEIVDRGVSMSQAIAWTAVIYTVVAVLLWSSAVVFTPRAIRRDRVRPTSG